MNLHEECLLKYLLKPSSLALSTEMLIQNNEKIIRNLNNGNLVANRNKISYSTNRI